MRVPNLEAEEGLGDPLKGRTVCMCTFLFVCTRLWGKGLCFLSDIKRVQEPLTVRKREEKGVP